jgi:DNA polymerase III epsilon subunit-like protein
MISLVMDTETGGMDAGRHSLLSVAAVVIEEGTILDQDEFLLNPELDGFPLNVEAGALAVNKLNLDQVRAIGLAPRAGALRLQSMLRKHGVRGNVTGIFHNALFDVPFIQQMFRLAREAESQAPAYGSQLPTFQNVLNHRTRCTMQMANLLMDAGVIQVKGSSLGLLCDYFNVRFEGQQHSALTDARATAQVYFKMIQMLRSAFTRTPVV